MLRPDHNERSVRELFAAAIDESVEALKSEEEKVRMGHLHHAKPITNKHP